MLRIEPILAKEDLSEAQWPLFDDVTAVYSGRVVGPFRILLHSPELAWRFSEIGRFLRLDSTLPAGARELAIIVVAREMDCPYEWMAHQPAAERAGVSDAAINAVRHRDSLEGATEAEAAIVRYFQELFRGHRVTDASFKAVHDLLGTQHLVELTATAGFYVIFAYAMNAFQMPPDHPVDLPVGFVHRRRGTGQGAASAVPRILPIQQREQVAVEGQRAFDEIAASRGGRIVGPFPLLLHSPELARRVAHAGGYVRYESPLSGDLRELVILSGARENNCAVEWTGHEELARQEGTREEAIVAIRDWQAPLGLVEPEATAVLFIQELLRTNRVSDVTFSKALRRFGVRALVDLTGTAGYYSLVHLILNAFNLEPERSSLPL